MKKQGQQGVTKDAMDCVGIHDLLDWEIIQYRAAVDAHRVDLSKAEGRCVAWQDAELDFNAADRKSMGEKWRVEYCGMVCPERENCLVATRFFASLRPAERIQKFG